MQGSIRHCAVRERDIASEGGASTYGRTRWLSKRKNAAAVAEARKTWSTAQTPMPKRLEATILPYGNVAVAGGKARETFNSCSEVEPDGRIGILEVGACSR